MKDDCYGTCPKCGEIGWCHYKGKARIFKSGPGSDTYKVSLFKCGNCGKKFGFELINGVVNPRNKNKEEDNNEEEKDDWAQITGLLWDAYRHLRWCSPDHDYDVVSAKSSVVRALDITEKHCRCDS